MGQTAVNCEYVFLVPDKDNAHRLVEAFVTFGFPPVTAGPHRPSGYFSDPNAGVGDWDVTVLDEAPYASDEHGTREREAVKQEAKTLARRFGRLPAPQFRIRRRPARHIAQLARQ